tara:strand:+ start:34 stop:216 length:183 start_codon:yes stop_codon:yes gene_type:complete
LFLVGQPDPPEGGFRLSFTGSSVVLGSFGLYITIIKTTSKASKANNKTASKISPKVILSP